MRTSFGLWVVVNPRFWLMAGALTALGCGQEAEPSTSDAAADLETIEAKAVNDAPLNPQAPAAGTLPQGVRGEWRLSERKVHRRVLLR